MNRLLIIPAALAALSMAACDETYDAIPGTNPPQFLVRDNGDKIDGRVTVRACSQIGRKLIHVQPVGDGRRAAIVTCGEQAR